MASETMKTNLQACDRCGMSSAEDQERDSRGSLPDKFVKEMYFTTVCSACIDELNAMEIRAASMDDEMPGGQLIEGVHYYMERNLMVFTELYHIAKGYCCKSGCRHCAYGYKSQI